MKAGRTPWVLLTGILVILAIGTSVLAAPFGSRSLYVGRIGADVAELQRRLNSLGYAVGSADGVFGPRTRAAVTQFEQNSGLVADGLADQWTFQALNRADAYKRATIHTVKEGESLSHIAASYGTTSETLIWLNQLSDRSVKPGQVLRIPAPEEAETPPPTRAPDSPSQEVPTPPAPPSPPPPSESPDPASGPSPDSPSPEQPEPEAPVQEPETPDPAAPAPEEPAPEGPAPADPDPEPETPDPAGPGQEAPPSEPADTPRPQPGHAQWILPGLIPLDYLVMLPPTEPTHPQPLPTGRPLVIGYYAEDWQGDGRALQSLNQAGDSADMVVNFQLQIDANGNLSTRSYPELMATAKERGLRVYGLVHNYRGSGFDANVARSVLGDPTVRAHAIEQMLKAAQTLGLDGIDIDIENVPPDQRANYTALIKELSERLKPEGLGVTISIPAKTYDDRKSAWSGAFDYAALGQYADRVAIMAYDEHTPGYTAGPVASVGWVEKVAQFASSQIEPQKVLLGIATYGYDWVKGTTHARGLSVPQARALAAKTGATVQWDPVAKVPWFSYWEGGLERVVYFEDERSLAPKLDLVSQYGLGGIAIWRLGLEEPTIWPVINEKLR